MEIYRRNLKVMNVYITRSLKWLEGHPEQPTVVDDQTAGFAFVDNGTKNPFRASEDYLSVHFPSGADPIDLTATYEIIIRRVDEEAG